MEVHLFHSSAPTKVAFKMGIFEAKLFCLSIAHQSVMSLFRAPDALRKVGS